MKCWNLERLIDVELVRDNKPKPLTMEDLLCKGGDLSGAVELTKDGEEEAGR